MNKISKTPILTSDSKILSFDLETNNLHGQAFAIGAVVTDGHGKIHSDFTARCPIKGEVDDWVQANVLPVITDIPQTHGTYESMREAFWRWYLSVEPGVDYVLVSNGYPVEYSFLLDCQRADLEDRYWKHPFPILDLTSLIVARAEGDINAYKGRVRNVVGKQFLYRPHNPVDDAKLAVLMAFESLGLLDIKA